MFKIKNILQSRIKEISGLVYNVLILPEYEQRISGGHEGSAQDEHRSGKGKSIFVKGNSGAVQSIPSSAESKPSSASGNASGVSGNASAVQSKSVPVSGNASGVSIKASGFKRKVSTVKRKSSSFSGNASTFKRKRSAVLSDAIRGAGKLSPEMKDFITGADNYLHYANGMLFFICNTSSIISFIVLRAVNDRRVSGYSIPIILFDPSNSNPVYFIIRAENANVFEGVIERYSGTPP